MKVTCATLLAIMLIFPITSATAEATRGVFDQASPSVVTVLSLDVDGKTLAVGSGVVVPGDWVATSCQVIGDGWDFRVWHAGHTYAAYLRYANWKNHFCSLNVPGLHALAARLSPAPLPKFGTAVYVVGSPNGRELGMSQGVISGVGQYTSGMSYIYTTMSISQDFVGGGLFDVKGTLLGVTTSYLGGVEQLTAVPIQWVESLPSSIPLHDEDAWFYSATIYELGQHYRQAIAAYLHALQVKRDDVGVLDPLAVDYNDTAQYATAIVVAQRALRNEAPLAPKDEGPFYGMTGTLTTLVVAYTGLGEYSAAEKTEQQALRDYRANVESSHRAYEADKADQQLLPYVPDPADPDDEADFWSALGSDFNAARLYKSALDAEIHSLQLSPLPSNPDAKSGLQLACKSYSGSDAQLRKLVAQALSPDLANDCLEYRHGLSHY